MRHKYDDQPKSNWVTDPGTYPLMTILALAPATGLIFGLRAAIRSPDVHFDREKRKNPFRED